MYVCPNRIRRVPRALKSCQSAFRLGAGELASYALSNVEKICCTILLYRALSESDIAWFRRKAVNGSSR